MKYIWRGTSGYVPALGEVQNGSSVGIVDQALIDRLLEEKKIESEQESTPRSARKRGGE